MNIQPYRMYVCCGSNMIRAHPFTAVAVAITLWVPMTARGEVWVWILPKRKPFSFTHGQMWWRCYKRQPHGRADRKVAINEAGNMTFIYVYIDIFCRYRFTVVRWDDLGWAMRFVSMYIYTVISKYMMLYYTVLPNILKCSGSPIWHNYSLSMKHGWLRPSFWRSKVILKRSCETTWTCLGIWAWCLDDRLMCRSERCPGARWATKVFLWSSYFPALSLPSDDREADAVSTTDSRGGWCDLMGFEWKQSWTWQKHGKTDWKFFFWVFWGTFWLSHVISCHLPLLEMDGA